MSKPTDETGRDEPESGAPEPDTTCAYPDPSVHPDAVERLREQTRHYQTDPSFRAKWDGLSTTDLALRTAQQRAFVTLLAPVWSNLGGKRVLDVGCGAGRWLRWYLELGASADDLVGVDVSDCRFADARRLNPTITYQQIDGENLPFEDGRFDLVTQWVCFMCIPTDAWRHRMAAEIRRVLRPGGYLFWWDTPSANPKLTDGKPIDPATFFPDLPIERMDVAPHRPPSEALERPLLRATLGRLLDRWAAPPTHVAARLGPR
ncbi:MAG: class I SAM-dependent methyltransferase [Deltaproteobacteria bacterium]|jgi:SAM-dependent methyltransferase|nr:class I SAM-dependent methyltransferase [Deltaproteobacteria bacterium]MBW2532024.1 class I SAM-dependent methyltransferase [Deltaproteobacteria bacterium]